MDSPLLRTVPKDCALDPAFDVLASHFNTALSRGHPVKDMLEIPYDVVSLQFWNNLFSALKNHLGEIWANFRLYVYFCPDKHRTLPRHHRDALATRAKFRACRASKQEEVDREISNDVREVLTDYDPERTKIVIVSSDKDYCRDVRIAMRAGFSTYVIHAAQPGSNHEYTLKMDATEAFRLKDLLGEQLARRACGVCGCHHCTCCKCSGCKEIVSCRDLKQGRCMRCRTRSFSDRSVPRFQPMERKPLIPGPQISSGQPSVGRSMSALVAASARACRVAELGFVKSDQEGGTGPRSSYSSDQQNPPLSHKDPQVADQAERCVEQITPPYEAPGQRFYPRPSPEPAPRRVQSCGPALRASSSADLPERRIASSAERRLESKLSVSCSKNGAPLPPPPVHRDQPLDETLPIGPSSPQVRVLRQVHFSEVLPQEAELPEAKETTWLSGRVSQWKADKGWGFVKLLLTEELSTKDRPTVRLVNSFNRGKGLFLHSLHVVGGVPANADIKGRAVRVRNLASNYIAEAKGHRIKEISSVVLEEAS